MAQVISSAQVGAAPDAEGTSHHEVPLRFRAGQEELFGILSSPPGRARPVGIILLNATSDRNRFLPRLARRLAAEGCHVLRFDYHGFGESSGPWTGSATKHAMITLQTLQEPFTADLLGAVRELERRGVTDIVLVGRCFGSRTALSAVPQTRGLRGVVLISLPLHEGGDAEHPTTRWALDEVREAARRGIRLRALRGLLNPRRRERWLRKLRYAARQLIRRRGPQVVDAEDDRWVSRAVVESLRAAARRRVPVLFVYGRAESVYKDFLRAQAGPLRSVWADAGDRFAVALVDGPTNNLTTLAVQDAVMEATQAWLAAILTSS